MTIKERAVLDILKKIHGIVDRMQHPATLGPRKQISALVREAAIVLNPSPSKTKKPTQKTLSDE